MNKMVNGDLRLWKKNLMRFAQQVHPSTIFPQYNAVSDEPPAPTFSRACSSCSSSGDVLRLVEGLPVLRESRDEASKRSRSLAPATMGPTGKKSAAPRRLFSAPGQSWLSD